MSCHGGPVQTSPKVYLVFWGSSWADTSPTGGDPYGAKARVLAFVQAMGGSGWKNTATQYYDPTGNVVGNPGTLMAGEFDDPNMPPAQPQQPDFAHEASIAAAYFGDTSSSANYVILTPNQIVPVGFVSQFCAYHSLGVVPFTAMPYVAGTTVCGSNFVNPGPTGLLDGVSIVLGHEQAETETDPFISAWWSDVDGMEIGDKCAWYNIINNPAAGNFPTQPLWSNASTSCVQHYP